MTRAASRALVAVGLVAGLAAGRPAAFQTPADGSMQVELEVPGGKVVGSLLMPASAPEKVPVVLIIAGSGPTDRDGNTTALPGKNNAYRLLAEALAAKGIASLRYDKRGLAASRIANFREGDVRFEHFVSDAASWIAWLRNDARFSTITVAGHSEGSLIGMLAGRAARADGFVSIAGPARKASDALRTQIGSQLAAQPDAAKANEAILASLDAGKTVDPVPAYPGFPQLYRPSVQPYLISWFKYTPAIEVARLTIPVLLVQGTTDIQVLVSDAQSLKAAKSDATIQIVDGMNHVLKMVPSIDRAVQIPTYSDPSLPVAPAVPQAIVEFVNGLTGPGKTLPRRPTGQRVSLRGVTLAEVDGAHLAIEYGRPTKRGRAIWGALVPWDKVWMPGADEASTLTTSETLVFGSLTVPAGEYTIYTLPTAASVKLIINRQIGQYHTVYDEGRDLGRVDMTMTKIEQPVERMTLGIASRPTGGALTLGWDDREYSAAFVVEDDPRARHIALPRPDAHLGICRTMRARRFCAAPRWRRRSFARRCTQPPAIPGPSGSSNRWGRTCSSMPEIWTCRRRLKRARSSKTPFAGSRPRSFRSSRSAVITP